MWLLLEFDGTEIREPLSSNFLFVRVIEVLSRMVEVTVRGDFLYGFPMGKNLSISHLLFADDTIFFYDALSDQIQALRAILVFWSRLGPSGELEEVRVGSNGSRREYKFFSKLVGLQSRLSPWNIWGCLWRPLLKPKHIKGVIEKVEKIFSDRKRIHLSKGGY